MHGTFAEAGRQTGLSSRTIQGWSKEDWFEEMMQQAIRDTSSELRAVGMQIVRKATAAVLDRLENGDEISDKHGKLIRRKVAMKDALLASLTWFDKNRIINEQSLKYSDQKVDPKALIKEMMAIGRRVKDGTLADLPIPEETPEEAKTDVST
jgi:hypothetical protein